MKYSLAILTFMVISKTLACDVCGCSLGGFSQGVMPNNNHHFIGLKYNLAGFSSAIDHSSTGQGMEFSDDAYQRLDLMARYTINARLKLNAVVPFLRNTMVGNLERNHVIGFGDPLVLVQYQFIHPKLIQKNHFLTLGSGIKLPVGRSDLNANNNLVNRNFQLGTGSFDFLLNAAYFFRKNKSGFSLEANYKLNTTNRAEYRFGNQLNMSANYAYLMGKDSWNLIWLGGVYFENAEKHSDQGLPVLNTGGTAILLNAGLQLYVKKLRFGLSFQQPVYQNYLTDNHTEILAKQRFTFDLLFFFGEK